MNKINGLLCAALLGMSSLCFSLDNDTTDNYSLLSTENQKKFDELQHEIDVLEQESQKLHLYFDTSGKITAGTMACGIIAACIDPTHVINGVILAICTLGGGATSILLGHEQKHLEINTAKINALKNKQQEIVGEYS